MRSSDKAAQEYLKAELDHACYRLADALAILADDSKGHSKAFIAPKGQTLYIVNRSTK
jgi:hypothetical protein